MRRLINKLNELRYDNQVAGIIECDKESNSKFLNMSPKDLPNNIVEHENEKFYEYVSPFSDIEKIEFTLYKIKENINNIEKNVSTIKDIIAFFIICFVIGFVISIVIVLI